MYQIFEHTADLGIRIEAEDLNTLFAEAGRALFSIIVTNVDAVHPIEQVEFNISGTDREFLLCDWLSELLFAFEKRRLLLTEFTVDVQEQGLSATARGETVDTRRHRLEHEVKAVTYHGLKVEETDDRWIAEVIVDI